MNHLDTLPEDLLLNIFGICDVNALLNISLTCRRFYLCIDKEIFWKQKLQNLYRKLGTPLKITPGTSYKSACLRFCAVFEDPSSDMWTECVRCQDIFCSSPCIQDRDDVIIFDFGSKTTWFKYASDSTGQLSMHPTVPQTTSDAAHFIADDIYQSCPVCSKMFQNKSSALSVSQPGKSERSSHRRLTSAFSRLAMRHFPSCFDSGDLTEEVLSLRQDLEPSGLNVVNITSSPSDSATLSSVTTMNNPSVSIATGPLLAAGISEQSLLRLPGDLTHLQSASLDTHCGIQSVSTYKFLIMHMLKRNPFFQAQRIPFVLCEPTDCTDEMKIQLLQFLFTQTKVPGISYIPKPVATALYSGLDTCLVLDSGANNTVVSPVVEQSVLTHCVQHRPIGGTFLTKRLQECILLKGVEFEIDWAHLDSSQVKRECYLAYNMEHENRKCKAPNTIHVKGFSNGRLEYQPIVLGPELYLACEDIYLNINLPEMIQQATQSLDTSTAKKLLSNIVLTGGNCRLNGLAIRLTKDLEQLMPEYQGIIRVFDPRLMTGRTDAVIGASYIRKWFDAYWVTRQDYILHGAMGCMERSLANQVHCV